MEAIQRRGRQRRDRHRALLAACVAVGALAVTTAAVGASGSGGREVLQPAAPPSPPLVLPSPSAAPSPAPTAPDSPSPSVLPPPVQTSPTAVPNRTQVRSPSASPAVAPTRSPTAAPTASSAPTFPPALTRADPDQRVWGVYLAVARGSDYRDPRLAEAERQAEAVRYRPSVGDLGCDPGAAEALGLDPKVSYAAVALYFENRRDARQFVDAYEPGVVGTAEIVMVCND